VVFRIGRVRAAAKASGAAIKKEASMSGDTSGATATKWIGRAAIALVALGVALAALVAVVVPGVVRTQAAKGMEAATGRRLAIGAVAINPFTWKVQIEDVSLSEQGGKGNFASLKRGQASVSPASILRGAPVISHVRLEEPHFNLVRTGPNAYNFSDLVKYLTLPVPAISLEDVAITGGSIDFADLALPKEERHTVRDAELKVPFLTTVPSRSGEYGNPRFSAVIDGARLVIETRVRGLPRAPEVSAQVNLKDLSLPVYLSYLPSKIPVQVDSGKVAIEGTASYRVAAETGSEIGWDGAVTVTEVKISESKGPLRVDVAGVSIRARVTIGDKKGVLLEDGAVEVRNFTVPFRGGDGMTLELLSVSGVRFVEQESRLEVADVQLSSGRIRLSRDLKGVFSPMPLLEHLQAKLPHGHKPAGRPVQYLVKKVEGKGLDLVFTDGMRKELPSFAASGVRLLAENISGPLAGPIAFSFSSRLGKDATIRSWGKLVPTPLAADVDLELKGLALADGRPYVPEGVDVSIVDGRLDLRMTVAVATHQDHLTGTYGGSAAIRSLKLTNRERGKLVAWERLSVDGVKGTLAPMTLQIARVELAGMRADLVMDEDGEFNLPVMPEPPPDRAGKGEPAFKAIRLDELVMSDGAVNFTDKGVPGDFHATVKDISVRVTGISSEPGKVADVRAHMTMPKGAPLRIAGKAALLKRPAYADLELELEKLDLSMATPYSGIYLGLEVDRGTLTVKSVAKVDQGKLAAENRIRVDQLKFGKAVESDEATILPVQLLVDILRDKNGDIVLDLPVAAKTDDENVSGVIVRQMAKDVIFPPGSPLRNITFAGCSAALDPDAQGRLRKLATALQERPAMKITAVGYVDQEGDGKACREVPVAEKGAAPPLEGDARMKQLAEGRAAAVRDFLVLQGTVNPARVAATTGDLYGGPKQKGERKARVEFTRATD
jgi:hypothetical protein